MSRREISAGCVVYRGSGDAVEVALIRPRGRDAWALPKGMVEKGESQERAAMRETLEETGLSGDLEGKLDTVRYSYLARWESPPVRVLKIVTFFLLHQTGGDPTLHDAEVERVDWFPIRNALMVATYRLERGILEKAMALISESE